MGNGVSSFVVPVPVPVEMSETNQSVSVVPWGRLYPIRKDLQDATKTEAEGGNAHARKFWEWSEEQIREFC